MNSQGLGGLLLPILILVFFYFFLIVPEQKKQKKAKQLIESLTVGSSIITRGGIYGKIVDISGDTIVITTGPDDVKISVSRFSVASVTNREETREDEKETVAENETSNEIGVSYTENEVKEASEGNEAEQKNE